MVVHKNCLVILPPSQGHGFCKYRQYTTLYLEESRRKSKSEARCQRWRKKLRAHGQKCRAVTCLFSIHFVPADNFKFVPYKKIVAFCQPWFVDPSQDTSETYSTSDAWCWLYKRTASELCTWTDNIMTHPGMPRGALTWYLILWTWKIKGGPLQTKCGCSDDILR